MVSDILGDVLANLLGRKDWVITAWFRERKAILGIWETGRKREAILLCRSLGEVSVTQAGPTSPQLMASFKIRYVKGAGGTSTWTSPLKLVDVHRHVIIAVFTIPSRVGRRLRSI